jgi:UDP-N-acetylmuramoyl-tripeptide--D-alanyl-D-alanine ligase
MDSINLNKFLEISRTTHRVVGLSNDFMIKGVAIDSRLIQPGDMFIAIPGERFDGHDFATDVIEAGASVVVASDEAKVQALENRSPIIYVADSVRFLMEFAGWYRLNFRIPVYALTGSTGKTTTKEMLATSLQTTFQVARTQKNMNNFIGVPLTLLQISDTTDIAVVELGTNQPGEIAALTEIVQPTHAAITNIGSGHIGFFGSREAIYREKKALFDGMKEGTRIFLNMDDTFLAGYRNERVVTRTCGLRTGNYYQGEFLGMDEQGHVRFRINHGHEICLKIPGKHQLMNALLAGSMALDAGLSPETMKTGLESVLAPDKRMDIVYHDGVMIINDTYNSNPESLHAAIDYLCDLPLKDDGRKIVVLGDMLELGEKSEEEHRQIGRYLASKDIYAVLCMGNYSRFICEEFKKYRNSSTKSFFFSGHSETARKLSGMLTKNDLVLLKGSRGMTMEKILTLLEIRG